MAGDNHQETINAHIEQIAVLRADVRWLKVERKKADKHRDLIENKVINNQRLLHGAFIGGGIVMVIFTALSPILLPYLLDALK